jgi:hypothetical protein
MSYFVCQIGPSVLVSVMVLFHQTLVMHTIISLYQAFDGTYSVSQLIRLRVRV